MEEVESRVTTTIVVPASELNADIRETVKERWLSDFLLSSGSGRRVRGWSKVYGYVHGADVERIHDGTVCDGGSVQFDVRAVVRHSRLATVDPPPILVSVLLIPRTRGAGVSVMHRDRDENWYGEIRAEDLAALDFRKDGDAVLRSPSGFERLEKGALVRVRVLSVAWDPDNARPKFACTMLGDGLGCIPRIGT